MATAATNYNIKQITGYDIIEDSSYPITYYNIVVPKRNIIPNSDGQYEINEIIELIPYKTVLSGVQILKMGYCCEPKGMIYPIFLEVNGSYEEIKIGREGMYEMQPETWKNVNDQDSKEKTTDVTITGVRVPVGINFTLDYVVAIN